MAALKVLKQETKNYMKAIALEKPGLLQPITMEVPQMPGPGEALIRIHSVGVCGTDLHAFRGEQPFFTYPRILGHELSAEIVALGPQIDVMGHMGEREHVDGRNTWTWGDTWAR